MNEWKNERERQLLDSSCQISCRDSLWLNPNKSWKEMEHVDVVPTDQAVEGWKVDLNRVTGKYPAP